MGGRIFWVRCARRMAGTGIFSSKGRAGRRFHVPAMGGPGLGPVLREYVVSEAMAALDVPTTRALAVVATGETVQREKAMPGAVLTRVAPSHLRIGTFQYFAARQDIAALTTLTEYAIGRHYPDVDGTARPACCRCWGTGKAHCAMDGNRFQSTV